MSGADGSGSDFWSRRRASVKAAEEAERAQEAAEARAEDLARLEEKSDQEILEELGLPDPDGLTEKDDFTSFLSAAVPERLRRRALRRLWTVNPVLANLDGLVDYAEDYTDAATVVSGMQTVYQVGKGMFDRFAALAEDEKGSETPDAPESGEPANESSVPAQCEENTALHNGFSRDGKTSFQLTKDVPVVHSDAERPDSLDLQEENNEGNEYEPQFTRRRLRFDYS
ncbi:DUF3306 domain-containing protein [Roseibium aggregatum]|uniref:DUF3306 domain-containing protein n=1 Tax=Roseibium aggregatum TaxID=187304 RepID=A0A939EER2_9HYPH|nr:DUF3306 domain-containing protein [Roseibium aggregatum]MBN9671897.1 DUF3306 domain-containing protein [Roseibium aggregatum]